MRFSLETLLGFMTLCAIDAALIASESIAANFAGVLLGVAIVYVPVMWWLNHARVGRRLRQFLIAISGGLVACVAILLLARWRR